MSEKSKFNNNRLERNTYTDGLEESEYITQRKYFFKELQFLQTRDSDESWEFSENLGREVTSLVTKYLADRDFVEIIELGREILTSYGISQAENVSSSTPAGAIAITEACNLGAKVLNPDIFYALKPALIVSAWKQGADFGMAEDETYYLSDPIIGTASFHDPNGEIKNIVENILHEHIQKWPHPWSQITRQDEAFDILNSLSNGGKLTEEFAEATLPSDINEHRKKWMDKSDEALARVKLGEILSKAILKMNTA